MRGLFVAEALPKLPGRITRGYEILPSLRISSGSIWFLATYGDSESKKTLAALSSFGCFTHFGLLDCAKLRSSWAQDLSEETLYG